MGISGDNKDTQRQDQQFTGHRGVDIDIIIKVRNSICKIVIKKGGEEHYGTGFFVKISDSLKYLITNYHNINPDIISENPEIEFEIWNKKKIKLNLNNRETYYFKPPKDVTVIEIKYTDLLYDEIEFLDYDNNYKKNGYKIYKNIDVFTVEHPLGKGAVCASGTIVNINEFEFLHNITTDNGSSGSPVILLNNNINLIQVIGNHKSAKISKKIN